MTGIGAYYSIVWAVWLRHCLNGRQDEYILLWPSLWTSLPEVIKLHRKSSPSTNDRVKIRVIK